ncbi:hypothetical protein Y1Q_0015652 [Alligator mississippiensis]|uniref:Uncharacterized protein n=1 Tax=Alligator mississippiensis TaxID=8496 RepID=A0A151NNJ6_ALLMI|nr:hypothetical protein Y1Q_0015652 [Alligator mississippiensis]
MGMGPSCPAHEGMLSGQDQGILFIIGTIMMSRSCGHGEGPNWGPPSAFLAASGLGGVMSLLLCRLTSREQVLINLCGGAACCSVLLGSTPVGTSIHCPSHLRREEEAIYSFLGLTGDSYVT